MRNTISMACFQVVEKIFPFLSVYLISIFYETSYLDRFGLSMFYVSTIISWSTSGINVAATKEFFSTNGSRLNGIYSLNIILSCLSIFIFFLTSYFFGEFEIWILALSSFAAFFASLFVFRKAICITKFEWKKLFISFILANIFSFSLIIFFNLNHFQYVELSIFVFYFILYISLRLGINLRFNFNKEIIKYFFNEFGFLYFTGIVSGSVIYFFTIYSIEASKHGIAALITIGVQLITILQFIPVALNRIIFIRMAKGESIGFGKNIFILIGLTLIVSIPVYYTFTFIGREYEEIVNKYFLILVIASIFSSISTLVGGSLVVKGFSKYWFLLTFLSTLLGFLVLVMFPTDSKVKSVFISLLVVYFNQFIFGYYLNEKFRILPV